MEIRIRSTGQVLLQHEWEKWVATTYGKSLSGLTAEVVNTFESEIVLEGPQATGGNHYQYSQRDGVEQIDGKWYTKYILGPVFTDTTAEDGTVTTAAQNQAAYEAIKDAEQAKSVRQSRDDKLKETDWMVIRAAETSVALAAEWATYRQALRDISAQAGFPWEVTWPDAP